MTTCRGRYRQIISPLCLRSSHLIPKSLYSSWFALFMSLDVVFGTNTALLVHSICRYMIRTHPRITICTSWLICSNGVCRTPGNKYGKITTPSVLLEMAANPVKYIPANRVSVPSLVTAIVTCDYDSPRTSLLNCDLMQPGVTQENVVWE
jgi:hypothetical protein